MRTTILLVPAVIVISAVIVQEKSAEKYAQMAKDGLNAEKAELLKTCKRGDLSEIYFSSYSLDGALAAAEAIGCEDCLKIVIECIDAIIAAGKDKDNDGYLDFYHSVDGEGDNKGWDITAKSISPSTLFKGLRPIPRAARIILQRFAGNNAYRDKAQRYLDFLEKHIIEKWKNKGYYPGSHQISLCGMMVDLYLATGNEDYRRVAEQQATYWKSQMKPAGDAYVWNVGNGPSDCSHANSYVGYATLACRAGIVFTEEDMLRYCATLKKVWRGPDKPLADYVDNTGDGSKWGGTLSDGWVKLGIFSPEVREMLAGRTRIGSITTEYWGNMALNVALGRDKDWKLRPSGGGSLHELRK